ncbi:MAG: hypothetical protein R3325_04400 [Thermoanaerobaculia bacterium]|nr:hypothetical protein [Thermoanaerobaculia bacterium]
MSGERRVELLMGLEVHVRLDTGGKLFCACPLPADTTRLGPNQAICDTCTGHPGTMPQIQPEGIHHGLALALALGAEPEDLARTSRFERKHYFYWDLPKNYQVTQIDDPLCPPFAVRWTGDDGESREVALSRIHLEEDAARKQEDERELRVDFNRSGAVLAEIVTEPGFRSPEAAADFLRHLREVVRWHQLGSGQLESGDFRCDVNLSVRWEGERELPKEKVELKNLARLDGLVRVAGSERDRLARILRSGGAFVSETREWVEAERATRSLRQKESAADYWYYIEPDLPDVAVGEAELAAAHRLLDRPSPAEAAAALAVAGFAAEEVRDTLMADPDLGFMAWHVAAAGGSRESCRGLLKLLQLAARELDLKRRNPDEPAFSEASGRASFDRFWSLFRPNLELLRTGLDAGEITPQQIKEIARQTEERLDGLQRRLEAADPDDPMAAAEEVEVAALTRRLWSSVGELLDLHDLAPALEAGDLRRQALDALEEVLAEHPEQRDRWLAGGDPKMAGFFMGRLMGRLPKGTDGRAVRGILDEYADAHRP